MLWKIAVTPKTVPATAESKSGIIVSAAPGAAISRYLRLHHPEFSAGTIDIEVAEEGVLPLS